MKDRAKIGDKNYIPFFYLKVYQILKENSMDDQIDFGFAKKLLNVIRIKKEDMPFMLKEMQELDLIEKHSRQKNLVLKKTNLVKIDDRKKMEKYVGFY